MPRIPQYIARYNRPAGTGMVPVSVVPDPLTGIGESIVSAAGDISRVIDARNERRRISEFGTLAANFERELADDYISYTSLKGKEAYDSQERLDKFEKLALQKYKSSDPLVNDKLALYIRDNITGKKAAYNSYEASQEEYETKLSIARVLDTSAENAFRGVDTLQKNVDTYTAFVSALHASGSISEEEATARIVDGERKIAFKTLEGLVYNNPQTAVDQLKTGLWDGKLASDDLKRFRSFAETAIENREKLRLDEEAKKQKLEYDNAIVSLTDAKLSGDPEVFRKAIGDHMPILTRERTYDDYMGQLQKMVDGKIQKVDESKKLDTFTELYFRARIDGQIKTEADLQAFKYDVANAVASGSLPPTGERSAEFLINKAGEYLRSGDSLQSKAIANAKSAIDSAYNIGALGKTKGKEGREALKIRLEMEQALLKYYDKNPDAKVDDYTAFVQELLGKKLITVPVLIGGGTFGGGKMPTVIKGRKATEEEALDIAIEKRTTTKGNLPSSDAEIRYIINRNNIKTRGGMVKYLVDNYGLTEQEAIILLQETR